VEIHLVEGFEPKVTNRTPEFLEKFPAGKIPAFEGADGFKVIETYAISKYSK
jgi:elongation factor 1-gamma